MKTKVSIISIWNMYPTKFISPATHTQDVAPIHCSGTMKCQMKLPRVFTWTPICNKWFQFSQNTILHNLYNFIQNNKLELKRISIFTWSSRGAWFEYNIGLETDWLCFCVLIRSFLQFNYIPLKLKFTILFLSYIKQLPNIMSLLSNY